jgi:hypothetical protein
MAGPHSARQHPCKTAQLPALYVSGRRGAGNHLLVAGKSVFFNQGLSGEIVSSGPRKGHPETESLPHTWKNTPSPRRTQRSPFRRSALTRPSPTPGPIAHTHLSLRMNFPDTRPLADAGVNPFPSPIAMTTVKLGSAWPNQHVRNLGPRNLSVRPDEGYGPEFQVFGRRICFGRRIFFGRHVFCHKPFSLGEISL